MNNPPRKLRLADASRVALTTIVAASANRKKLIASIHPEQSWR